MSDDTPARVTPEEARALAAEMRKRYTGTTTPVRAAAALDSLAAQVERLEAEKSDLVRRLERAHRANMRQQRLR